MKYTKIHAERKISEKRKKKAVASPFCTGDVVIIGSFSFAMH